MKLEPELYQIKLVEDSIKSINLRFYDRIFNLLQQISKILNFFVNFTIKLIQNIFS